jgi:hypothetical protein
MRTFDAAGEDPYNKFSAQVTGEREKQMNTTTSLDSLPLSRNSLLFWCTLGDTGSYHRNRHQLHTQPGWRLNCLRHSDPRPRRLSFYVGQGNSRHLFGSRSPLVPLEGRPAHHRNTLRPCNFHPVRRWAGHSEPSWLCAAHLYSLGNGALHDDRCRISSQKEGRLNYAWV